MKNIFPLIVCLFCISSLVHSQINGINDCANAEVVCSNEALGFNPIGPGQDDFADPDNIPGCITSLEQNSAWYFFEIDPNAPPNLVLGFTILPLGGLGEDYDWALFGPDVTCGDLGAPIRCSSSSAQCGFCPETGMGMGTTDLTEGPGSGDGFVMTLVVQPGQSFFLLIDNWQGTNNGFTMTWTGTAADHLNCDATPPCALSAIAGIDLEVCENDDPFELSGGSSGNHGNEVYEWSGTNGGTAFLNDPTLQDPTVTLPPGFTGSIIYTLTVTEDTCTGEDAVNVIINPLPIVTINPIGPFCENNSPVSLSGMPGGGQWSGENVGNMFHPMLAGPGTHTVTYTYTDFNGCRNTAELDIEVYEIPAIEITPDPATFCDNEGSVELSATPSGGAPDYMYAWSGPSGAGVDQEYEASLSGVHVVTVTDENGCTNTSSIQVESFANPEINILNPEPICQSTLVHTILATPAGGEFDGAQIDPSGEVYAQQLSPGTYSYSYTYTDNNNCSSTLYTSFTIVPAPDATASNNNPACSSQPILLFGSTTSSGTDITYAWTGPNGFVSTAQNPLNATEPGSYQLIITVDGCPSPPATTIVTFGQSLAPVITGDDTICIGNTTILDAGNGFANYTWSTGDTGQSITVSTTGLYELTVSDISGCTGYANFTVTVLNALMPLISGDLDFCEGSNTTLDAGSGYTSYLWSTGETSQSIVVSTEGNIGVVVTNADGCSGTGNVNTIVHALPDIVIGGSTTYCIGGFTTLDAGSGHMSYFWNTGATTQTLIVNAPGVYTVNIVDMNNCYGSAAVTVTESTSLSPIITGIPAFCEDGNTTLSAGSGFSTYMWSDGSSNQLLTVSMAGTYSVTVSDGQGCSGSSSVMVTEVSPPSAQIQNTVSLCNTTAGGSVIDLFSLITSGDMNGNWVDIDNSGAQGLFNNLDFNGVPAGTYTFSYTTNSAVQPCQEVTYNVEVIVNECDCEDVVIISTPSICNESTTYLISNLQSTSVLGNWVIDQVPSGSSPANFDGTNFITNQSDSGIYTFLFTPTLTPPPGCPQNYSASIQVDEGLSAGTAIGNLQFCESTVEIVQLQDQLTNNDTGGTWSEVSSLPSSGNAFDPTNGTFSIQLQADGSYSFQYSVLSNGACPSDEEVVTIFINPNPEVIIETPEILDCSTTTIQLNATGSNSVSGSNLLWNGPGLINDGSQNSLTPNINQSGTYTLIIENPTSCKDTASVDVDSQTEPPSGATVTQTGPGCLGEADGSIIIANVVGGFPPYSFSLNSSPFSSDSTFNSLPSGTFDLVIQDVFNCEWDTTITLIDPETFNVELGDDIEVGLGETGNISLITSLPDSQIDTVIWEPQSQITCIDPSCLEISILPTGITQVQATVIDINGCEVSDVVTVILNVERRVYIPNVFTPGSDNINDYFFVSADESQIEMIESFNVYSRWGELVFSKSDFQPNIPTDGWDGKVKGEPFNPGVFTYRIAVKFIDDVTILYTGDITLVR